MRCLLLVAFVASCVDGPGPDPLDMGRICDKVALEVRDPSVLPGWQVHALAVERDDGSRVWALASDGDDRLQVLAVADGMDGAAHDFSAVGTADELHLVPGAIEGQTWVLLDRANEAQVWRLADGALLAGPRLTDFPGAGPWTRRIVFLGGAAHLLSVPASGDTATLELSLARLDDTLSPEPELRMPLWRPCEDDEGVQPTQCQPPLLSGVVQLELLGTSEGNGAGGVAALIGMYANSAYAPEEPASLYTTLVSAVELRAPGPDLPPTLARHDLPYWTTMSAARVSPAFVAVDDDAVYWLAGLQPVSEDEALPTQDFVYRVGRDQPGGARIMATAQKDRSSHLLQVGGNVAFGQITGTAWTIAPMDYFGIGVNLTGALAVEPGTRVSLAGRGQFSVRSASGARRVAVTCDRE